MTAQSIALLAFEFPPINALLRWRDLVPGLNKVGMIDRKSTRLNSSHRT